MGAEITPNPPSPDEKITETADTDKSRTERAVAAATLAECLACAIAFECRASASNDEEEWRTAESQSLLHWAKQRGRVLPAIEFGLLVEGFRQIHSGLEHEVYYRRGRGRVFKITKRPYFGHTWELKTYLQNIVAANQFFEDDVQIEGVIEAPDGISIVTSQPYIEGRSPTTAQIDEWFMKQNATKIGAHKWLFSDGTIVSDAHTGNLILTRDGTLIPIDLHVEMPK